MPWHLTWQLGGTQPFCTHFHVPKPSINWTQFLIGLPSRDLHLSSCKPQVRDLKTHSCKTGMLWAKIPGFLTRVRPPNVNMVGTMFISVFMMTRNLQQMIYDNTCCGKALSPCLLITASHPAWTPHLSLFIAAERLQQLGSSQASWDKASECHSQSKAPRFSQPLIQLAPWTYPYPILFITFECCQQSLLAWEPLIWRQCPGSVGCCTS